MGVKSNDEVLVLFILGLVMFIPGSYYTHLAYCSYRQYEDYTFDDFPDYG